MTTIFPWRRGKSPFDAPAITKSFAYGAVLDTCLRGPLGNVHGLSGEAQDCVAPPIVILDGDVRPSAIFWMVISVVVDSIKRHTIRALAHVTKEVLEEHPALTDGNTPTTVVRIVPVRRIKAAFFHCCPGFISRRFNPLGSMPMPRQPCSVLAMAGLHVSSPDMRNHSLSQLLAFLAPENRVSIAVPGFGVLDKGERAEAFTTGESLVMWHSGHESSSSILGLDECSGYGQREHKLEDLVQQYRAAGGVVA